MKTNSNTKETLVIAHRGGGDLFPENTLTAFRQSEELGVDAIECDIHRTKDGKLVIAHDPDLNRIAGINKKITAMTSREISKVKLKSGESIPLLEEVLREIKIPLVVELKSMETVKEVIGLLTNNPGYAKKSIFISFYHKAILLMKERFPNVSTGALMAGFPVDPVSVAKSCRSDTLAIYYEGLTKEYVDMCHKGRISVSVWTPNSEADIKDMIKVGADLIASDRPDIVLKALNRT